MKTKVKNYNPDRDYKNMTIDQLIIEWEQLSDEHRKILHSSDFSGPTPTQMANNEVRLEKGQIKMWAIEKEIIDEYKHLIGELNESHYELWCCCVGNPQYKK